MEDEIQTNPGIINNDRFGSKDYSKYAYFVSKAKNHTIIIKPQVDEVMANGERRVSKDDQGKEMIRVAVEFHNGMKRFDLTPENQVFIDFLRGIVEKEKDLPENRKSIKEVKKPTKLYTEEEVKRMISAQKQADEEVSQKEKASNTDEIRGKELV